jgi:hypothetical protein
MVQKLPGILTVLAFVMAGALLYTSRSDIATASRQIVSTVAPVPATDRDIDPFTESRIQDIHRLVAELEAVRSRVAIRYDEQARKRIYIEAVRTAAQEMAATDRLLREKPGQAINEEVRRKYTGPLGQKYGLTIEEIDAVLSEGSEKHWPE